MKNHTKPQYKLNAGHIIQKIADKTVIYSGDKSLLYTLNDTATYMLNGLKLGWSEEKIIAWLTKIYAVSKQQAEKDLHALKTSLEMKKILVSTKNL